MLAEGRGVAQDMERAILFFRKAAGENHEEAQRYLAIFDKPLEGRMGVLHMEAVAKEAHELANILVQPRVSLMVGVEPMEAEGAEKEELILKSAELDKLAAGIGERAKKAGGANEAALLANERDMKLTASTRTHASSWSRALKIPSVVPRNSPDHAMKLNDQAVELFARGRHLESQSAYHEATLVRN